MKATHYQKRLSIRQRWSRNAVRAKARKRLNPITGTESATALAQIRPRWDWKINLTREDGQRLQLTLVHYNGKLIGQGICESSKQLGRRLGIVLGLATLE